MREPLSVFSSIAFLAFIPHLWPAILFAMNAHPNYGVAAKRTEEPQTKGNLPFL
jgi:hypothetical protein